MQLYHQYAPFYDLSGQVRFTVLMGQYVGEILERHPVNGKRALDIACGTGTLALILADQGWNVTGVDTSEAMLEFARIKAENLETPGQVRFIQGDMRDLPPEVGQAQYDLALCTYDSLNYLLEEKELVACFKAISHALAYGGLFIGDMNTRYFLEHDWGDYLVVECPGFVQVTQSHFEPETACSAMTLTGFVGDDQQGYQRFDETHVERAYPFEVVAALLEQAGLEVEAAYDCFTFQAPEERTQRIAWIARKRDKMTR